jgi:hypothetical protein
VKKRLTRPKFVRRAVAVSLCYILVLQAFLTTFSIAVAVSQASTTAGGVICHTVGHTVGHTAVDDTPAGPDNRTPASDSCAFCALCAPAGSAGALPSPTTLTVAAPRTVSRRVGPFATADLVRVPPARAGLARAPPKFA